MIRLNHVSKIYGDGSKKAVDDLSWDIEDGKITGFIGPNGAGKTTLMRIMTDLLAPSTGRVLLDGQDIAVMGAAFRKKLGYLPQDFGVYPNFTAEQFLLYIARLKGLSKFEAKRQTDDLLRMVGLEDKKQKKLKGFSGGQRQRLSIARAIAKHPQVYLFDDSFSALDFLTEANLRRSLNEKIQGKTQIVITQRITSAMNADHIFVMDRGRLVDHGVHAELLSRCKIYQEIYASQTGGDAK